MDQNDPLGIRPQLPLMMGGRLMLVHPGDALPVGVVVDVDGDALIIDLETPTQAAGRMTHTDAVRRPPRP